MGAQVIARGSDSSPPSAGCTSKDCSPAGPSRRLPVENCNTRLRRSSSPSNSSSQSHSACVRTSSLTEATSRQRRTASSPTAQPAQSCESSAGVRSTKSGLVRREPPKTSRMPERKESAAFCKEPWSLCCKCNCNHSALLSSVTGMSLPPGNSSTSKSVLVMVLVIVRPLSPVSVRGFRSTSPVVRISSPSASASCCCRSFSSTVPSLATW
mmetsp:Transcript_53585/g.124700  ORF Transcript_53585/g.124700 Transcript_53585/m.124700 type:complete len:211 (+) Transcript_53585:145-777(+)